MYLAVRPTNGYMQTSKNQFEAKDDYSRKVTMIFTIHILLKCIKMEQHIIYQGLLKKMGYTGNFVLTFNSSAHLSKYNCRGHKGLHENKRRLVSSDGFNQLPGCGKVLGHCT